MKKNLLQIILAIVFIILLGAIITIFVVNKTTHDDKFIIHPFKSIGMENSKFMKKFRDSKKYMMPF